MPGRVWLMCIEKLMLQYFVCVVAKVIKKKIKILDFAYAIFQINLHVWTTC